MKDKLEFFHFIKRIDGQKFSVCNLNIPNVVFTIASENKLFVNTQFKSEPI